MSLIVEKLIKGHSTMTQTTGYLNLSDGKLYYETAGEGQPLILVHAGFVDSGMWDEQFSVFAEHYNVIRFDQRGFGKSDAVQAPVSRRDDLLRLMDHLKIEKAHLVGCSMGGGVVIDFALDHPERVLSLVPVSAVPDGFEMRGEMPEEMKEMMEAAQKGDLERVSELQIRLWVDGPFRQPEQVNPQIRQHAAEMTKIPVARGTFAAGMNPLNPLTPPAAGRLAELKMPTLIIAGALDNSEIVRAADVMASEIKHAQKHIIQEGAHVPNMDKPAEFNRAVLNFLDNVN
jgi:2-hydroxy-6-oxonona-2,4-dienedioate hydrolase